MEHRDVFILESIVEYCDKAISAVEDIEKETFLKPSREQDLCAFYCLQIGENANSLSEQFKNSHPEVDWRGIIGLRHNIAHEYGNIDPSILWDIVQKEVPALKDFCTKTINI